MYYTTFYVITKSGYLIKGRGLLGLSFWRGKSKHHSLGSVKNLLAESSHGGWCPYRVYTHIHIYACTHMRERSRAEKESQRVARVPQEQPYPFPRAHPAKT